MKTRAFVPEKYSGTPLAPGTMWSSGTLQISPAFARLPNPESNARTAHLMTKHYHAVARVVNTEFQTATAHHSPQEQAGL